MRAFRINSLWLTVSSRSFARSRRRTTDNTATALGSIGVVHYSHNTTPWVVRLRSTSRRRYRNSTPLSAAQVVAIGFRVHALGFMTGGTILMQVCTRFYKALVLHGAQ